MITIQHIKLLNKHNWNVDYFESLSNFAIVNDNGSQIHNSETALIALIDDLVEADSDLPINQIISTSEEEFEILYDKVKTTDEELLGLYGYEVICESPFEIEKENEFISGQAAKILVNDLKDKKHKKDYSNFLKTTT